MKKETQKTNADVVEALIDNHGYHIEDSYNLVIKITNLLDKQARELEAKHKGEVEGLNAELNRWKKSSSGHVYVADAKYSKLVDAKESLLALLQIANG